MPTFDPAAFIGITVDGRYQLVECIGQGGFCLVFRAGDLQENREVAVKVLPPGASPADVSEFETEGELLVKLARASHVIDLLDRPAGQPLLSVLIQQTSVSVQLPYRYLVLELMDGTLADIVVDRQQVDWIDRLRAFRHVVQGVHQMHLQRVVHRDTKSENILLRGANKRQFVTKVSDLGRSRDLANGPRFLADDYIVGRGDLRFAPPEYLWCLGTDEPISQRRADIYLLGSILFELATGQPLTSMAIGNPRPIVNTTQVLDQAHRAAGFAATLPTLASRYESVFKLFDAEVDIRIRDYTGRLVRQLSNPDPGLRENRTRAERNLRDWGLEWLLRRIDILDRALQTSRHRVPRAS